MMLGLSTLIAHIFAYKLSHITPPPPPLPPPPPHVSSIKPFLQNTLELNAIFLIKSDSGRPHGRPPVRSSVRPSDWLPLSPPVLNSSHIADFVVDLVTCINGFNSISCVLFPIYLFVYFNSFIYFTQLFFYFASYFSFLTLFIRININGWLTGRLSNRLLPDWPTNFITDMS